MRNTMIVNMRALLVPVLALGLTQWMSCASDDTAPVSLEEQQRQKLVKQWVATSVTRNNVAQPEYTNFELVFTDLASEPFTYQVANRPAWSPWPASGTWAFGDDPLRQLVRDPASAQELELDYVISPRQLQLFFTFSKAGFAGRTQDIQGQWVFTFTSL
jgi:hypothetical protein